MFIFLSAWRVEEATLNLQYRWYRPCCEASEVGSKHLTKKPMPCSFVRFVFQTPLIAFGGGYDDGGCACPWPSAVNSATSWHWVREPTTGSDVKYKTNGKVGLLWRSKPEKQDVCHNTRSTFMACDCTVQGLRPLEYCRRRFELHQQNTLYWVLKKALR